MFRSNLEKLAARGRIERIIKILLRATRRGNQGRAAQAIDALLKAAEDLRDYDGFREPERLARLLESDLPDKVLDQLAERFPSLDELPKVTLLFLVAEFSAEGADKFLSRVVAETNESDLVREAAVRALGKYLKRETSFDRLAERLSELVRDDELGDGYGPRYEALKKLIEESDARPEVLEYLVPCLSFCTRLDYRERAACAMHSADWTPDSASDMVRALLSYAAHLYWQSGSESIWAPMIGIVPFFGASAVDPLLDELSYFPPNRSDPSSGKGLAIWVFEQAPEMVLGDLSSSEIAAIRERYASAPIPASHYSEFRDGTVDMSKYQADWPLVQDLLASRDLSPPEAQAILEDAENVELTFEFWWIPDGDYTKRFRTDPRTAWHIRLFARHLLRERSRGAQTPG